MDMRAPINATGACPELRKSGHLADSIRIGIYGVLRFHKCSATAVSILAVAIVNLAGLYDADVCRPLRSVLMTFVCLRYRFW